MAAVVLTHLALGVVLGLGCKVDALVLPSIAALVEGLFLGGILHFSFAMACLSAGVLLTIIQCGYLVGSIANERLLNISAV